MVQTYKPYGCQNRFGKALNFGNVFIKHVVSDNEEELQLHCISTGQKRDNTKDGGRFLCRVVD